MGEPVCVNGGRVKKLIRSPQFQAQFAVANSFGFPVFKAESIDDMNFEQFRVLAAMLEYMHKEVPKEVNQSTGAYDRSAPGHKERHTIRIVNEE